MQLGKGAVWKREAVRKGGQTSPILPSFLGAYSNRLHVNAVTVCATIAGFQSYSWRLTPNGNIVIGLA